MAGQRKTKSRSSRRVAGRAPSTEPLAVTTAAKPLKVSVGTNANRKRARQDDSDEQTRQKQKQQRTELTADVPQTSPTPELQTGNSHDFQSHVIAPSRAHSQEVAGKPANLSLPQDARSHDAPEEMPGLHPKAKRAAVSAGDEPSGKRNLRSRDSRLRLKSKLAHYFPYYEDFMNDEPIETGSVPHDIPFAVVDDEADCDSDASNVVSPGLDGPTTPNLPSSRLEADVPAAEPVAGASADVPSVPDRFRVQTLQGYATIERCIPTYQEDPLPDSRYSALHLRAERAEKRPRNIEKSRADYERGVLETLLKGLQGADWPRAMGLNIITDAERRAFEPKRQHFVAKVLALVNKFKAFRDHEKDRAERQRKRKRERGDTETTEESSRRASAQPPQSRPAPAPALLPLPPPPSKSAKSRSRAKSANGAAAEAPAAAAATAAAGGAEEEGQADEAAVGNNADVTDAAAARQLQKEAGRAPSPPTSAALGNSMAFGYPIPELPEADFQLPLEYRTAEVLARHAREKRRMKRAARSGA